MNKKANMPVLGGRQIAAAPMPAVTLRGQKEEALDIPATTIRRPVFARQITTEPEEQVRKKEFVLFFILTYNCSNSFDLLEPLITVI